MLSGRQVYGEEVLFDPVPILGPFRVAPWQADVVCVDDDSWLEIGDRAFDSANLGAELKKDSVGMIAPCRSNRHKLKTQAGRRLRCYERRWIVERFFARLPWKRRVLVRWEYYASDFLGFVQLD